MFIRMESLNPIIQTLIATTFTWFITALGAAVVFANFDINKKYLNFSLGFSAGIMISASFWSLLLPAVEMANSGKIPAWIIVSAGFLAGGFFLRLIDLIVPHLHLNEPVANAEGIKTGLKKTTLLIIAITIHNLPEGMAIGVAFGSIQFSPDVSIASAIALALGIGIQNFPEGIAVSMPLRKEGFSKFKSFWYGQLSAIVEPVGGIIGVLLVKIAISFLPFMMGFAAGAMIYVVVEELIPESQKNESSDVSTTGLLFGFVVMMILDVAFS